MKQSSGEQLNSNHFEGSPPSNNKFQKNRYTNQANCRNGLNQNKEHKTTPTGNSIDYKPLKYPAYSILDIKNKRDTSSTLSINGNTTTNYAFENETNSKYVTYNNNSKNVGTRCNNVSLNRSIKLDNKSSDNSQQKNNKLISPYENSVTFSFQNKQQSEQSRDILSIYSKNPKPSNHQKVNLGESQLSSRRNPGNNFNRKLLNLPPPLKLNSLTEEDKFNLHMAILDLYKNRIKPHLNEIWSRLSEYKSSILCRDQFIHFYLSNESLYEVKSDEVKYITVFLKNPPPWFKGWIDVKSPHNYFPEMIWKQFLNYCQSGIFFIDLPRIMESKQVARYNLAKVLHNSTIPFFKKFTLGEIYHLIELSLINGLLIYDGQKILPSISSELVVHSSFCLNTWNCSSYNEYMTINYIKSFDELLHIIIDLLKFYYPNFIYLSRLKSKIYQRYNLFINPWFFNYSQLEDLISDQFANEVVIERHNNFAILKFNPCFIYRNFLNNDSSTFNNYSLECILEAADPKKFKTLDNDPGLEPPISEIIKNLNQAPKSITLEHWKNVISDKRAQLLSLNDNEEFPIFSNLNEHLYSTSHISSSLTQDNGSLNFYEEVPDKNIQSQLSAPLNNPNLIDPASSLTLSKAYLISLISLHGNSLPDVDTLTSHFLQTSSSNEFRELLNYYVHKINNKHFANNNSSLMYDNSLNIFSNLFGLMPPPLPDDSFDTFNINSFDSSSSSNNISSLASICSLKRDYNNSRSAMVNDFFDPQIYRLNHNTFELPHLQENLLNIL